MVLEELRCQVYDFNSNLLNFILICKELERKYTETRQQILERTIIMPNDQNLQNYLNNLMRVSSHLDPKVADACDHLNHKTPSLHEHRHHQEVEMGIVQAILEVGHSAGQAIMRDNEDTSIHDDETTHGVMTVNDMESTFERIEESYLHHLDCI